VRAPEGGCAGRGGGGSVGGGGAGADPPLRVDPGGVLARELGRLGELRGAGLKAVEDLADAHVCAYVGLWWWARGPAATLVAGDDLTGAILVPRPADPVRLCGGGTAPRRRPPRRPGCRGTRRP